MNAEQSRLHPGIDHIHLTMTRWRTSMADCIRLRRLSLPVAERSTKLVAARTADHVHRVPEFRCTHLVGHVLQHSHNSAVPDLVEQLTTELRVVALLVNRERTFPADNEPPHGRRNHL